MNDGGSATPSAFERWITAGWYGAGPIVWLVPLVPLFVLLAAVARLWQRLRRERLAVPVVVVGNLTVGGAGKTPFVIWLVQQLRAAGRKPGVISRGYGSDGAVRMLTAAATAAEVGDEALLIVARTGVPLAVGADRVAAGRALLAAHPEIDVVVSDDGLQHLRLARDAEVVVVDGRRGFGNGWRLPAGPLRDATGRLAAVDVVIANGVARDGATTMALEPGAARRLSDGAERPLSAFSGAPARALAGIGDPERFFRMLEARGLALERHPRRDHAPLDAAALPPADGRPLLMTEKDAVKLGTAAGRDDLWVVPVTAAIEPGAAVRVMAALDARLGSPRDG